MSGFHHSPIYGSSRLGSYYGTTAPGNKQYNKRKFELTNHLGNVLATVSDKVDLADGLARARVMQSQGYYPFGLDYRRKQGGEAADGYRYGFNGKERDKSFGSTVYDYGFRIYNPQIAKFLSVDPLTKEYPMLTPYQYATNNPILMIDLDGLEGRISILASDVSDGLPELRTHDGELIKVIVENGNNAIQKPLNGAAVKVALKRLQKGRLLAADGRTFTTSRMFEYDIYDIDGKLYKNVERGVNFGTKNTTTKGINQIASFKNRSVAGRLLGLSKFAGVVLGGLPAAEALLKNDIGKLNPIGFVAEDMIAEFEAAGLQVTNKLVDNSLNSGTNKLQELFESNKSVRENFLFEGASFETLRGIFSGDITDFGQFLDSNSDSNSSDVNILFKMDENQDLQLKSVLINDSNN